jgi:hypothetical protein
MSLKCSKCGESGSILFQKVYIAATESKKEHLKVRCLSCSYQWEQPTADAKGPNESTGSGGTLLG